MLAICSPLTVAMSRIPGTAWIKESTEKEPALYPASPGFGWAPAIVPPVARMVILGFAGSGAGACFGACAAALPAASASRTAKDTTVLRVA